MKIVFENEHFVAVDKPAGWLSVPGREGAADPRPCAATELRKARALVLPVHRLDLEVSGLVLFAKTSEAHRAANAWFEGRSIHKRYEAFTEGAARAAETGEFLWQSNLVRGKRRTFEAPHGKPSATRARLLGHVPGQAWLRWELEPLTGRSHQLRFELAKHGYPIVGDALYGSGAPFKEGAIALRSIRLDFIECADAKSYGLPTVLEVEGL